MQNELSFKGCKGSVEATFTLNQESTPPTLSLHLSNSQTCIKYFLKISEEYILTQDSDFTRNIESVADLYQYLSNQFDGLTLTQEGAILFAIEVVIKKKLERKIYRIEVDREIISDIELLTMQMEKMRREIRADSEKKDQRISELEHRQFRYEEENQSQFETLKSLMNEKLEQTKAQRANDNQLAQRLLLKVKEELERHGETQQHWKKENLLQMEEIKNKSGESNIRQIREQTERFGEGLARIYKIVEEHENKILEITKIKEEIKKEISRKSKLKKHPENPHKESFILKDQYNGLTVTKVGHEGWMSYFGEAQLEIGKVHTFQIKQIKLKNRFMMVGIGSRNAFGVKEAYQHKQTMTYSSCNGYVFEMGSCHKAGKPVNDGSVVSVVVDLVLWRVEWLIDGKPQATANISAEMQAVPLFLLVMMSNDGDSAQLIM